MKQKQTNKTLLDFFVYKYKKGEENLELVAGFIDRKEAWKYGKEYIEGDLTDFIITQATV